MTRRVRGLIGLMLLLALAVGLPWALATTIGDPRQQWPSIAAGDMSDQDVIAVMAALAYLAWASFALALIVELAQMLLAALTGWPRHAVRLPLLGVQQDLARALIAAVLLLAPAMISAAGPATSAFASSNVPSAPRSTTAAPDKARAVAATPSSSDHHSAAADHYLIPGRGGMRSYWALAEHYLGDGQRWPEIWTLNEGHTQPDGSVMDSPNLLRRGWTVLVPATQRKTGADEHLVSVRKGDTLSGLAERDGVPDWRTVWPANQDRPEPGGVRFSDPNLIRPGWNIALPGPATTTSPATTISPTATTAPRTAAQPPIERPRQPSMPTRPAPSQPAPPQHPLPSQLPTTTMPADGPAGPVPTRPTRSARPAPAAAEQDSSELVAVAQWAASLAGGAGLLAAGTFLAVRQYRRRQFRHRRAGRAIPWPAARHRPLEKVLIATGAAGARDVDFIDQALRGLSMALATADGRLPPVAAARLSEQHLDLLLAQAQREAPPAPWVAVNPTSWVIEKSAELPVRDAGDQVPTAPYPTLVSVGYTATGDEWLLDLEQARALILDGDRDRCLNLARFVVAELAHNVWSDHLAVTLAGELGPELVQLNPSRLIHNVEIAAAAAAAATDARAIGEVADEEQVDVLHGRLHGVSADTWMPQVLVLAASAEPAPATTAAVEELLAAVTGPPSRTPVALVLHGVRANGAAAGLRVEVASDGTLRIPSLDVTATAQQLPADQAEELAQYLAAVRDSSIDVPMPPATPGADGQRVYTDMAGAVLPEHTLPRSATPAPAPPAVRLMPAASTASATALPQLVRAPVEAASVLPNPTSSYLVSTATPAAAIESLAAVVEPEVGVALLARYPHLDEDLAAWHDPASTRPKLRLLGQVAVTAFGPTPDARIPIVTEAIAYLALHKRGVTGDQFASDFWPHYNYTIKDSNPKGVFYFVRTWLGRDPVTGARCLPYAKPGGRAAGTALYRMSGVLVDWDLFTALRARGQARGAEGITDLVAALELVSGPPLRELRETGGAWLADDTVADARIMTAAILDTASTVVSRALDEGDLELARRTAEKAVALDSGSDQPLIDLAAVCKAQGRTAEVGAIVRRIATHHGVRVEVDIPKDTYAVMLRHGLVS